MNTKSLLAAGTLALAIAAAAQGVKTFASEGGQMRLTFTSWAARMLDDGRITFLATGKPVRAVWGQRKTTAECQEFSGTASRKGRQDLEIDTALMKGGVTMVTESPSANKRSATPQTVVLKASTADYTASTGVVKLSGSVAVTNDDPGAGRKMLMRGTSATVGLGANLNQPDRAIRSAVLEGPVFFTINGVRDVADPKTGKKTTVPVVVEGRANRLTYDGAERKLSLIGNVSVTSDDPLLSGSTEGLNNATIVFNERFDPVSVEMNGDPGTSSIQPKKGGKD